MATASEVLANPELYLNPVTDPKPTQDDTNELLHFHLADDDIRDIALKIYGIEKRALIEDVRSVVMDFSVQDSLSQVPTITMRLHDPDWELLNTGALDHVIDVNPGKIPHRWYRLDRVDVNDDDITLTFITRNAAYLSYHKRPYKISRNKVTRAEFILTLLHHVKKTPIKMFSPRLHEKQPIAKLSETSRKKRDSNRDSGFSPRANITVKGVPADSEQRQNIEDVLTVGVKRTDNPVVLIGAVMTIIQESAARRNPQPPNPPYVGLFQQNPKYWPATGDPFKDAPAFYDHFIPIVKANPNEDIGKLIEKSQGVTGSTNPLNKDYALKVDRWRDESERAVKAFVPGIVIDPGGGTDNTTVASGGLTTGRFEFMVGDPDGPKNENYLAATFRLAEEVNWRAFWVRDVLYYQSEEELYKSRARARIRRFQDGVESVQFAWDRGKAINQMIISVRMPLWFAPVGTVIIFDEGGPARGRWLVTDITRSAFSQLGTITLMKPLTEKKEPRKEIAARPKDGTSGDSNPVDTSDIAGSPKEIIDNIVIPQAQSIGRFVSGSGQGPLTPDSVLAANKLHRHLGDASDHAGWKSTPPGLIKYAVDMSTDWTDHTVATAPPEMVEMAKWLKDNFGLSDWKGPGCHDGHSKDGRYRFQICYLMSSAQAGDHFNHIHFGIRDNKPGSGTNPEGGPVRREPNLPAQPARSSGGVAWNDKKFYVNTAAGITYSEPSKVPAANRVSYWGWHDMHHTIKGGPYIK